MATPAQRPAQRARQQAVTASDRKLRVPVLVTLFLTQLVTTMPRPVEASATAQGLSLRGDAAGHLSLHRKLQQLNRFNGLQGGLPTPTASICGAAQARISCFDPASDVPTSVCCPSAAYVCNVSSRTCVPTNPPSAPTSAPVTPAPTATTPAPTIPYPAPPVKSTGTLDLNCNVDDVDVINGAPCAGVVNLNGSAAGVFPVTVVSACSEAYLTALQLNVRGNAPGVLFDATGGVPLVEGLTGCNPITLDGDPNPLVSCFLSPGSVLSKYYVPPGFEPNQVIGELPLVANTPSYFVFLDSSNPCTGPVRFDFVAVGAFFER